jgi:rubredoxin
MIVHRNPDDPEACANCGAKIGKLETPYLWKQHVVCEPCYERLSQAGARKAPVAIEYASVVTTKSSEIDPGMPALRKCPVCGSTRAPIKRSKGSCLVLLLLTLFMILPAVIYAILNTGYVWVCPDCGTKLGDIS